MLGDFHANPEPISRSPETGVCSHFRSLLATVTIGMWHTQKRDWILMRLSKKKLEHKVSCNWRALSTNVFPRYGRIHFLVSRHKTNQLLGSALKRQSLKCCLAKRSWPTTQPNHFSLMFSCCFSFCICVLKYWNNYEEGASHGNLLFADHR